MLVSVVIPAFNRASLLDRAVRSVFAQTWPDLECIVVDDGSTDDTGELLERLRPEAGDRSFLTVRVGANRGVSAARNLGLAQAGGAYLALLDSDDYWLPEKLARQVAFMREKDLAVSQTEEIWIRRGRRVNPMRKHAKPSGRFFAQALDLCLVSPSCVLFTRAFWDEVGPFDESLPACEDYELWLRALLRYEIGLLPEALTVREGGRPDQLSGKIIGLDLYRIYALVKLLWRDDLSEEQRALTRVALGRKAGVYVRGCLKRDRPEEARRVLDLAREAGAVMQEMAGVE